LSRSARPALRLLESASATTAFCARFAGETGALHHARLPLPCRRRDDDDFHLPRSTLFMLVAAFSGLDTMQRAYAHAIAAGYRFYSYG